MSLYQFMMNNFVITVIEKRRDEGRAEERATWRDWNRHRLNAEDQGRPFDDPLPANRPVISKTAIKPTPTNQVNQPNDLPTPYIRRQPHQPRRG